MRPDLNPKKRKEQEQEIAARLKQDSISAATYKHGPATVPYQQQNTILPSAGAVSPINRLTDNQYTAALRDYFSPYNQTKRYYEGVESDVFGKGAEAAATGKNPYRPGTALYDTFQWGKTGVPTYAALSAQKQLETGNAAKGINDPAVARAALGDAWNKYAEAYANGKEWRPTAEVATYLQENAGKGYSFGSNAGELHDFKGDVVRNAQIRMANKAQGKYNDDDLFAAGEYDLMSLESMDSYIADLPTKIAAFDPLIESARSERSPYEQHWDKAWFRDLHECQTLGLPLEPEDMYQYAVTMHPNTAWAKADFWEDGGDPEAIAFIQNEVAAMVAAEGSGDWAAKRDARVKDLQAQQAAMQRQLDDVTAARTRQTEISKIPQKYAQGDTEFRPESFMANGADFATSDLMLYINLMNGGKDQDAEWMANVAQAMGREHLGTNNYDADGLAYLTPEEVGYFNAEWNANHDPAAIMQMVDLYRPILNARRNEALLNKEAWYADTYGLAYDIYNSTVNKTAASLEGARNWVADVFGSPMTKDTASSYYDFLNKSQFGQERRADQAEVSLPGWGRNLYNVGTGILGEGTRLALTSGLGAALGGMGLVNNAAKAAQVAYEATAGMEALGAGLKEGYERGYGDLAKWYAAADALWATATEHIGADAMFSGKGNFIKTWAGSALPESVEEVVGLAGEQIIDPLFNGAAGVRSADEELYLDVYNQTKSVEAAEKAVRDRRAQELADTITISAGVGAGLGAMPATMEYTRQRKTGKAIADQGNAQSMINLAAQLPTDTEAHQLAVTLQEQTKNGGKISNSQLGRLFQATAAHLDEESKAVVSNTSADAIAEAMVAKGEDEESARAAAPVLAKQLLGEKLTPSDRKTLTATAYGLEMMEELNRRDDAGYRKQAQLAAMFKPSAAKSIGKAARAAESLVSKDHVAEGKKDMGVGVRSTDGKPSATGEFMRFEVQDGVMKAVVKGADGKETMHNYTALEYKSRDIATIAAHAAQNSGGNAELANVMLQTYSGGDVQTHIGQMETAFRAGYDSSAVDAKTITRFSGDAKLAYQIGQKQAQAAEAKRLENIGKVKLGKGSVSFEGGEMPSGLTKQQRNMVAATRAIAEATGINFTFFQSAADSAGYYTSENGSYDGATNSIRLDLLSGKERKDDTAAYAILRTASHELTHFIEANSKENYSKLRQFISDELARKGQNFDALVQEKIDRSRAPLTRGGAIAEVVADGCEMMLKDSKAIQRLMQKDASLGEQLKNKLAEFVGRIRTAFKDINPASTEANALMDMRDGVLQYANELVELWDEGLVEAVENTRGGTPLAEGTPSSAAVGIMSSAKDSNGNELFSLRSMREDYGTYKQMLIAAGESKEDIDALFNTIDEVMKAVEANKAILDFGEDVGRDERSFVPVKPNADSLYEVSLDFSTLCRKRLLQQAVQERLESKYDTVLTKAERVAVRNALKRLQDEGLQIEVACALCYVESARLKSPAQIEKFLNGKRKVLVDYFAKQSPSFKKGLEERVAAKKVELGYAPDTPKTKMSKKDAKTITTFTQEARRNYKPTEAEEAIIREAEGMDNDNFRTATGLWALKRSHPDIFNAYVSHVRNASKSKGIEGDTAFWAGDTASVPQATIDKMNRENGMRSQSWSDFQVIHVLDYMGAIIELSTRNAKMQSYTKVPDFVRLLGRTGAMINLSLIPQDYDGTLAYDGVEGMPYETAQELRDIYHEYVGNICIGISDDHICALLANNDIDYVIPYHKSALDKKTRVSMGLKNWSEYESSQTEKNRDYATTDKGGKMYGKKPNFSDWFAYKDAAEIAAREQKNAPKGDKTYGARMAMQEMANRYIELCHERGLQEKFPQFSQEDGYWKLLIDRKMIDQVTGDVIEQKAVKPVFDKADILGILQGEVDRFHKQHADFEKAAETVAEMWERGDIRKAAKSKEVRQQVSDYEDTQMVRAIADYADDGGVVQADRAKTQYSLRSPVTDTPAFREWFAGSKVVNEDGSPKLMYHGTNANDNFTVFDTYGSNFGLYGIGSYFTDDRSVAEGYTKKGRGKNPRIYEVYLNVQNPLDMDAAYQPEVWKTGDKYIDAYFADAKTNADAFRALTEYCKDEEMDRWEGEEFITDHIMSKGFDGITHIGGGLYTKANPHLHRVYIVFEPDQIKSADPVTYDDEGNPIAMEDRFTPDADIRYSERTQAPATTRDYLLSMTDEDLHTDGEKDALARYRATVDELSEKTMQLSQQQDLAQKETGDAKVAAQNRAEILAKQVDRLEAQIRGRERTNVFKPIMAEAKAIVEASRLVDAGATMEEAVKKVAGRMHADSERKISTLRGELRESKNTARKLGGRLDTAERRVENLRSKLVENEQQFRERLEKFRERVREERKVRESVAASRKRIVKMVKTLDKLRRHETDYKHVPEELKPVVNALVSAFAENSSMVFDSKRADRIAAAYAKLKELDNDLAAFYDDDIRESIEYIADLLAANRGKSMKPADYAVLENVVGNIYKMVRNGNNAFFEGQSVDFGMLADDIVDSMKGRDDFRTRRGTGDKVKWLDDHVRNGNMLPVYYFDNLGNDTLKRMGYDILRGQDQYGLWARQDHMTVGDLHKKYNYQAWAKEPAQEFTTKAGRKFQLTKEQALWVYATAKREASNELAATHHLDEGGFVFGKGEEQGKGKWETHNTTPIKLSAADVKTITDTLTAEQKAYADAVVKYLSTDIGARGNDVSMRMYGYRKYREQYYFPYRTASDQRQLTSVSGGVSATDDARLKHQSFTNPLKKGANTPLVLGSFTDIAVAHMNAMNTYAAMVIPVENLNRVLNRKTDMDGTMTTIRALMAQKYGESTRDYLTTLLTDLNGGVRNESRTGLDGMISAYKKGAVMASASVFLQQATSIARVGAVMDAKYLAKTTVQKRDWDELAKWSGVATIKDMGRFDVGVGKGAAEWIGSDADEFSTWQKARQMMKPNDWKTFKTRWDDALNFLPGWADRVTWCHIWNAVKAEQADLHNGMDTSSDAFMQLCAERFNDIINHTQVYDSTMTRSQMMRSKSGIDKMVTAFASEPTLILNMLYDAISNPAHKGKRKKLIARTLAGVALSQVMAAAMQAVASAWRDDDDERTAMEKFLDKFGANVFENFNLLGMFPIIRDIYDTFTSNYEVERSDMALFSEMKRAMDKLLGGKLNAWQTVEEVGGVIAKFFGVPLKNVMRDLRAGYNAITSDWSAPVAKNAAYAFVDNAWGYDDSNKAYYGRLLNAVRSGDTKTAADLMTYLTVSKGAETDNVYSNVRNSFIKPLVQSGEMGMEEAVNLIDAHFPYDKGVKEAYKKVNEWLGAVGLAEGETADASGYGKLTDAMLAGNAAAYKTAQAELLKFGYTEKQISTQTSTFISTAYKNGDITWAQAEKMYKQFTGMTDANDLFWQKEKLDYKGDGNWSAYKPARDALLAGDRKTFRAEKSKLLAHGKKNNGVTDAIGDLKDELIALYETDPTAARKLRSDIVWAYMECGKTKESANKIIDGWFK